MTHKIVLCILFQYIWVCFGDQITNTGIVFHYNNTYQFNKVYTVYVSRTSEYIMEFDGDLESYDTPARVTVASDTANKTYPLFITARQQKGVFSWQLPAVVATPGGDEQFANISRTLCPHNNLFGELRETCDVSSQNTPIIHLTSSSPDDVRVLISVATIPNFYIKHNVSNNLTITPSQPQYFFYPFKQDVDLDLQSVRRKHVCNEKLGAAEQSRLRSYMLLRRAPRADWLWRPKSVIVTIESDDDLCAVVSIQNFSCPVFDNERDILYDGYYFTMTRRGGITLTQDKFPLGFYIVFIVKSSDEDCLAPSGNVTAAAAADRVKRFSFKVVETISYQEYLIAASAALVFFLAFYAAFGAVVVCRRAAAAANRQTGEVLVEAACAPRAGSSGDGADDNTDTSSEASTTDTQPLCLAHLSKQTAGVLAARSSHYAYHALTLAVFYTLPVAQLAFTYQILVNQSGNGDLCYLNLLCARPLYKLSDFNHVYSNLGYALLGALFLLVVWRRQRQHRTRSVAQSQLGIPPHFGLLYAMGLSLVSEGILSASYHVCPNSMNFQFDTSFMYVTGVLCMIKIYQSRHPDINARAHATFGVLALIIFIGVVGILNPTLTFWVLFTVLHLTTCFVLTFQIYYMGRLRLDGGTVRRAARRLLARPLAAVRPARAPRGALLLLANLANWALAALGVSQHSRDFGSHLLTVVMTNLFLYTLFYIVMKLLHRERIRWYSWVFIALAYSTWFSSSYFYLDQSTDWALTPAQSRLRNRECSLLQFYDSHDIWHFMSAMAMFFSFNMYLTIDDNLSKTPRDKIMVF